MCMYMYLCRPISLVLAKMWENFSNGPAATREIKGTNSTMPNPTYKPHWVVAKRRWRQFDVQPYTYIMSRHKYHPD